MEPDQADRDARLERILDELDDVEAQIEELRPAGQARSLAFATALLLFLLVAAAALAAILFIPGAWDLAPFLIAAFAYAVYGWKSISSKN